MGYLLNSMTGAWAQVKKVQFAPTTLANVQLRVELTTSNFDYSKVNANGSDLRFTANLADAPSYQYLDYWIETWSLSGTSVVWVKVPTAGTQAVYLWAGNPAATDRQAAFTSFMDPGFIWGSYTGTSPGYPQTYGGNDLNLDQALLANQTIAGQVIGTTAVSGRWEGWLLPEEPGEYTYGFKDDDGGRAWIDGVQVYNQWVDGAVSEFKYQVTHTDTKPKAFKYEWYNNGGSGEYHMGVGARTGRRTNYLTNPSFEVDLSSWGFNNCSGTRVTTDGAAGTACMQLSITNTTAWAAATGANVPKVQPGTTYTFSFYAKATSGTPTFRATINWLDENLAYISGSNGTTAATTTAWTRYTVSAAAVANAKYAQVFFDGTTTANGNVVLVDAAMLEKAAAAGTYFDGTFPGAGWNGTAHASSSYLDASARVNCVINPSFGGSDLSQIVNPTLGSTTTVNSGAGAVGLGYGVVTGDGTGALYCRTSAPTVPASAGEVFIASAYVKAPSITDTAYVTIQFFAADGTGSSTAVAGATVTLSTSWQRVSVTTTAPAGTVSVRMTVRTTNTQAAGAVMHVDGMLMERGSTLSAYFDGSIPPASWTATAHASPSILYPTDRANHVVNPQFASTYGWVARNPSDTNLSVSATGGAVSGGYLIAEKYTAVSTTATIQPDTSTGLASAVSGEVFYASIYMKSPNTTSNASVLITWYDANKAVLSESTMDTKVLSASWVRWSGTATAPANTAYVGMRVGLTGSTSVITMHYSNALLERSSALGAYFDGSTTGSSWLGAANASVSLRRTSSTSVTYPFPPSWVYGPKYDPGFMTRTSSYVSTVKDVITWEPVTYTATNIVATDFSNHPVGASPADWHQPWSSVPPPYEIATGGFVSSKCLQISSLGGTWNPLVWLRSPWHTTWDVESLILMEVSSLTSGATPTYYEATHHVYPFWGNVPYIGHGIGRSASNGQLNSTRTRTNSASSSAQYITAFTWAANTKYWVRARINSSLNSSRKIWQQGTAEPGTWTSTVTWTAGEWPTYGGLFGLNFIAPPSGTVVKIHYFSCATGGATAPLPQGIT